MYPATDRPGIDTGHKPYKCNHCDQSFSRGDVLTRHIRATHPAEQASDQSITPSDPGDYLPSPQDLHGPGVPATIPSTGLTSPAGHIVNSTIISSHAAGSTDEQAAQHNSVPVQHNVSSLLWPDAQDFYQSLTYLDDLAWDNPLPAGLFQGTDVPGELPHWTVHHHQVERPRTGDYGASEDGRRAVQTVNGLINDTVSSITSPTGLADLTPVFLDSSLHMFFTKFVPIFPVIHRPTFVFRDCSAPLLLNAVALGSLFLGRKDALANGEALWRLAYTAIATSWPRMISQKREHDVCFGVELVLASLLSQTYAALSRNRTLRKTSQTFYGLSMHWAQYCGMYDLDNIDAPEVPPLHESPEIKMQAWKAWVARETQLRTLLGLCVIDGVVSQYSGNLVNTWSATNSLPLSADDETFHAATADDWIRSMALHGPRRMRYCEICHFLFSPPGTIPGRLGYHLRLFDVRILLEILNALATESKRINPPPQGMRSKSKHLRALDVLRYYICNGESLSMLDRSIALLRWHAVCLDMVVSTARGARRMCKQFNIAQDIFGGERRDESPINPQAWIESTNSRRCLLHAYQIQAIASQMPLGVAHDVYLPGAIFATAITYSSFALTGVTKIVIPSSVDWNVVLFHGVEDSGIEEPVQLQSEEAQNTAEFLAGKLDGLGMGRETRNLSYDLTSLKILIRGLSFQWGVTQEMEKVVESFVALCL
ncbi:hypothetical protein jhhlp_000530 [Lomentospora prolificans]|uniref:C2H2-type domain-containing protein n=1 Tax=Lomentospora prolificans TaxID=41688 RepID=A0A2N3NL53_9PEZI|nr:hypothetical protein jhhlp_000530 [Lomentospora prolificans]